MVEHPHQPRSKSECPSPSPSLLSTHSHSGSHRQPIPESQSQSSSGSRSALVPQPTTRSITSSTLDGLTSLLSGLSFRSSSGTTLTQDKIQHERVRQQQNPRSNKGQHTPGHASREERLAREQHALLGDIDPKAFHTKYGRLIATKTNPSTPDPEAFCMEHRADKTLCTVNCRSRGNVEDYFPNPRHYKDAWKGTEEVLEVDINSYCRWMACRTHNYCSPTTVCRK